MLRGCSPDTDAAQGSRFSGYNKLLKGRWKIDAQLVLGGKTTPRVGWIKGCPPFLLEVSGFTASALCVWMRRRGKMGRAGFEWARPLHPWAYYAWNPSSPPLRTVCAEVKHHLPHCPQLQNLVQIVPCQSERISLLLTMENAPLWSCSLATMQSRLHPVTQQPSTATSQPHTATAPSCRGSPVNGK